MKFLLLSLCIALTLSTTAAAGSRANCRTQQKSCTPCQSIRWYKAKDGTYREMMPYAQALSRAEDADDMEPVLKKTQEELTAAKAQHDAVQAEIASMKAALEAQVADLQKQLEAEKQSVASQKERADKAEAAHKLCVQEIAQLRDDAKKQDEVLTATKVALKSTAEERDSLKTANAEMETKLTAANEAVKAAEDTARAADDKAKAAEEKLKAAQEELEKMKHDAAEAKKAAVEEEGKGDDAPNDADAPKDGEDKDAEDKGGDQTPETPAENN